MMKSYTDPPSSKNGKVTRYGSLFGPCYCDEITQSYTSIFAGKVNVTELANLIKYVLTAMAWKDYIYPVASKSPPSDSEFSIW